MMMKRKSTIRKRKAALTGDKYLFQEKKEEESSGEDESWTSSTSTEGEGPIDQEIQPRDEFVSSGSDCSIEELPFYS